jgi:hypothetical protein
MNKVVRFSMQTGTTSQPGSPLKRMSQWTAARVVLAIGRIPSGVSAPQRVMPPPDVPDSAIDDFLAALADLKQYSGEFVIHPRFGRMSRKQNMRIHMIHCAHHFGLLTPTNGKV